MNSDPPKLDYADPELPRPGQPPDGYLGYRSADGDGDGGGLRLDVFLFGIGAFIACMLLVVWLFARWWLAA